MERFWVGFLTDIPGMYFLFGSQPAPVEVTRTGAVSLSGISPVVTFLLGFVVLMFALFSILPVLVAGGQFPDG